MPLRQRAKLPTSTLAHAREMRTAPTDAEHVLWKRLRGGQLAGLKFRRQHPVPPYIADFCCEALKLVVEIDGSQHSPDGDARRTEYLASRGLKILRVPANDALSNTEGVLEAILDIANRRPLTPTPLPAGEGLSRRRDRTVRVPEHSLHDD